MSHVPEKHENPPDFWRSRYALGLIVIGAVAGYFLLTEHLAHIGGALPFLLLLSCPLMHVFMHHGHGGHDHHHETRNDQASTEKSDPPKQGESS